MSSQKTIFITGAASGIGRATAELFAERGWFVGLMDVNQAGLIEVHEALGADRSMWAVLDVTNRENWTEAVKTFGKDTSGRMDLFFNNAGIAHGGNFEEVPENQARQILDVNLLGVVHGIYACVDMLRDTAAQTGKTHIVNTSSIAGLMPLPGAAIYTATKFAVRGLTETLNIEFARHNIQVSSLMPFFTDTAMIDSTDNSSNRSIRERLGENKVKIHPVSDVAEQVWQATLSDKLHRPVGREAKMVRFMSSHFPGMMMAKQHKQQAAQDAAEN